MTLQENISTRLKTYMEQRAISQNEMAKKLGVSQAAISFYVNGHRLPTTRIIARIADVLDCSLGDLLRTRN